MSAAVKAALALEIAVTTVRVRRLLRRESLPEALAALRDLPATSFAASRDARELGRAVRRVLALLPGDTRCLTQALVLTALLARRGLDSSVVVAVSTEGTFAAHAWVERAGEPLLPKGTVFAPIVQL